MTNTNTTNFKKNMFDYLNQAIMFNDVININTENGNAVILSEEDYTGMVETLYLMSVPGMVESIKKSANEPIEEYSMYNSEEEW